VTGLYYVLLEVVKFSITVVLKEAPKKFGIKIKAKNYVILVELAKLIMVFLTVFVVPYVAPQLVGDQPTQSNTQEVQK
jgi:hypothetical protein